MAPLTRGLLVLLHLLGAIAWFGGMWFAYFCLRPAAAEALDPAHRLPLWAATFGRFFRYLALIVVAVVLSGFVLLLQTGLRAAPTGWLVMASLGLAMTAVFSYVYLVLYPRLNTYCRAASWPDAALVLNDIRRWVAMNLVFALGAVAAAVLARP